MAERPRARRNDGVTMAPGASPRKSIALLAAAVGLACIALLVLFGRPAPPPSPPAAAPALAVADGDGTSEPPAPAPEASTPPPEPEADAAPEPAPEAEAESATSAEGGAESAPTVPSGIGLFPPPGTDPIRVGIVVPDDFDVPEGYLRHYQVMDDGRDLEPILLLHPDYELLDDAGNPIPLPDDRVVPPELAPPGLPVRMLEVPEPLEETGP